MPSSVAIREIAPDTAVVILSGALTLGNSLKAADSQIQDLITQGIRKLVVDLTEVPHVDSGGLGALVHAYGLIHQAGGAIRLCGVQPRVAAMLKSTRTDLFLPIDPNQEASLTSLSPVT